MSNEKVFILTSLTVTAVVCRCWERSGIHESISHYAAVAGLAVFVGAKAFLRMNKIAVK